MPKKKVVEVCEPWLFNGKPFSQEMVCDYAGFIYELTFIPTGQKYIGKKFFTCKRKPKGKTRRVTSTSDWENYWSSSDTVKALVKEHGKCSFKREILSLHTLVRDVNYCEVKYQWCKNVLEELDENGNRVYLNENIQGKFFPGLYIGWKDRSLISE